MTTKRRRNLPYQCKNVSIPLPCLAEVTEICDAYRKKERAKFQLETQRLKIEKSSEMIKELETQLLSDNKQGN